MSIKSKSSMVTISLIVGLIVGALLYQTILYPSNRIEEYEQEISNQLSTIDELEANIATLQTELGELEDCRKPDLVIESISHEPSEPTTLDEITFSVVVTNIGEETAWASTLSFKVGGETFPETYSVGPLEPDNSYEIQRHVMLDVDQFYQITIEADIDDEVDESNEYNNRGIHIFQVMLYQETVRIGVIHSGMRMEHVLTLVELAEQDINDYCGDQGLPYVFDFLIDFYEGSAAIALEKVQSFKAMGINLIIEEGCSSASGSTLSYVNENDMLLLTGRSAPPYFYLSGSESCMGVSSCDQYQSGVIASMLWSYGIEAVVVYQGARPEIEGVNNLFEAAYTSFGGTILGRIRVPEEVTEFSNFLDVASDLIQDGISEYGSDHVGFLLLCPVSFRTFLTQMVDYPSMLNVKWFGSVDMTFNPTLLSLGSLLDQLGIYSPYLSPPAPGDRHNLESRYQTLTGGSLGYFGSHLYDACWLYALSVIETGSTDPALVNQVLPGVADDYFDGSGWCPLYLADRATADYDIWGHTTILGTISHVRFGFYDGQTDIVTWYESGVP